MIVSKSVWEHFRNVALSAEYYDSKDKARSLKVKKWGDREINIYFTGNFLKNDLEIVMTTTTELEKYTNLKFKIITDKYFKNTNSIVIYIGKYNVYAKHISLDKSIDYYDVYGLCEIKVDNTNTIIASSIYIDNNLTAKQRENVIIEELTQSLGFTNDTKIDTRSIFYQYKNNLNYKFKYNKNDIEVIKLLYNKNIKTNSTEDDLLKYITVK